MSFGASRHKMDTDNGANHVYVDVADDGANNNDGDGDDSHLDPDTLAKRDHPSDAEHYRQVVEQHLPRANTKANTNTNVSFRVVHGWWEYHYKYVWRGKVPKSDHCLSLSLNV